MPAGHAHPCTNDEIQTPNNGGNTADRGTLRLAPDRSGAVDGPTRDIVKRLCAAHAHFVLCDDDKKPLWRRWQLRRPSVDAVWAHLADGGPVGVMPASVSALVLDVDHFDEYEDLIALMAACPTRFAVRSRRPGGYHLYLSDDLPRPNDNFEYLRCSGDVRSAAGYVILWDPAAWASLDEHVRTPPDGPLPAIPEEVVPKRAPPGPSHHPNFGVANAAPGASLRHVGHSQRNQALFDVVRYWSYRQDRGGSYGDWENRVLDYTRAQNPRLQPPLPDHVLVGMARRIAEYTWRMLVYNPYAWLDLHERVEIARQKGIWSGICRRRGTPLERDRQPWARYRVSRSTWYRQSRRERGHKADAAPKHRPKLKEIRPWDRLGIGRSAWYERRAKILAGKVPPRLRSGWDYLGIGEIAWWEYLGLTEVEWELLYAPVGPSTTDFLKPDFSETELNRSVLGQVQASTERHPCHQLLPFGRESAAEEPLEWAAQCAEELVNAWYDATRIRELPGEGLSKAERKGFREEERRRKRLSKLIKSAQYWGSRQAQKFATKNRNAFHRAAARKTTAYKREQLREYKESLRIAWLDFLEDCEEERIATMQRTGIFTVSFIAMPARMPNYDPTNLDDRRAYAMMMRDVEKKNLEMAHRLFKLAQQRGEQPRTPPWIRTPQEELDRMEAWRPLMDVALAA